MASPPRTSHTGWVFAGCSSFTSGGYQQQACRFDWFFAWESQYTTWDHYYLSAGGWRYYGTYRCWAARYGGACGWL